MKKLIKQYKEAQALVYKLYNELTYKSDGYLYLTCLRCYGSINYATHTNEFTAQELCDEYNGENGIVDVYTNNTKCSINTYGDVTVLTLDELKSKSKDNISMSRAITNWISCM
jgi:hypothetical protein